MLPVSSIDILTILWLRNAHTVKTETIKMFLNLLTSSFNRRIAQTEETFITRILGLVALEFIESIEDFLG